MPSKHCPQCENKLQKLQEYELIEYVGENRHREYRPLDRNVESPHDINLRHLSCR
jgi:uncharacterized protein with PIN domain